MKRTYRAVTASLLALTSLVLLVGCASGGAGAKQNPAMLEGPNWTATQLAGSDGTLAPVVPLSRITAAFKAGTVSGKGSVNQYNATYATSGSNSIAFTLGATTMMAGPEPLMTQEKNYFAALANAKSYVVTADKLVLLDDADGELVVFAPMEATSLTGQEWFCNGYNNGTGGFVSMVDTTPVTATFGEDKRLSGSAGVNTYNTDYTLEGENMTISPDIATTRTYGPEPLMKQEQLYLAALPTTTRYEITGDELILWNGDARVASYTLTKP